MSAINSIRFIVLGLLVIALAGCGGKPIPPLIITTISLHEATVGYPYTAKLEASGGVPPYHWSVQGASVLPPGLTLDSNSGELGGLPLDTAADKDQLKKWVVDFEVADSMGAVVAVRAKFNRP